MLDFYNKTRSFGNIESVLIKRSKVNPLHFSKKKALRVPSADCFSRFYLKLSEDYIFRPTTQHNVPLLCVVAQMKSEVKASRLAVCLCRFGAAGSWHHTTVVLELGCRVFKERVLVLAQAGCLYVCQASSCYCNMDAPPMLHQAGMSFIWNAAQT